jgi:hypothetical protein
VVGLNEGGTGQPAFFDWTVDTTAPVVTIDSFNPSASLTDNTQATAAFSANEMATFQCRLDGQPFAGCASPFTVSNLLDGQHTFTVFATDTAGNQSAMKSHAWTVKTKAPTVQITSVIPNENPTNVTSRTYTFAASTDASGFVCALDGAAEVPCSSPYTVTALTDGAHLFSVKAKDSLGHKSQPDTESFTIDTDAPNVIITSALPSQSPTNVSSMNIAFTSDESASFQCSLDGAASANCTSPVSYANLADGTHSFQVTAKDAAGNVSAPASYGWTVDTTAPVLSLNSVNPSGALINQSVIALSFSTNEPATVICTLDGATADCSDGSVTYAGLADGPHSIMMQARDFAGNDGTPVTYAFGVDTTAPVVNITDVSPAESPTNQTGISLSFTSPDASAYQCSLDGAAYAGCASPASYANLTDGAHTFRVVGVDTAGNMSASPASYSWTVDTRPPSITLTGIDPAGSPTKVQNITFGFASDEDADFFCRLDDLSWESCSSPMIYNGLSDGAHTFNVFATDRAGNNSATTAAYAWTIDAQSPVTSIDSTSIAENPTEAKNITITFSANESATFQCSLDGAPLAPCSSPANYSGLTAGPHVFEVHATDSAGNYDSAGAVYSWRILSPPIVLTNLQVTNVTQTSVTLLWTSNVPCTTQGASALNPPGTNYTTTTLNSGMTTSHSVTITGLKGNTFYNFYGISTDGISQEVHTNTLGARTLR